jgi:transposase
MGSQEVWALLVARKQLPGRLIDVELSIRGIQRGFGLKVGPVTRKGFEDRILELVTGEVTLERIAEAMLSARPTLKAVHEKLHRALLTIVPEDAVCRRLMTVPQKDVYSSARLWLESCSGSTAICMASRPACARSVFCVSARP